MAKPEIQMEVAGRYDEHISYTLETKLGVFNVFDISFSSIATDLTESKVSQLFDIAFKRFKNTIAKEKAKEKELQLERLQNIGDGVRGETLRNGGKYV